MTTSVSGDESFRGTRASHCEGHNNWVEKPTRSEESVWCTHLSTTTFCNILQCLLQRSIKTGGAAQPKTVEEALVNASVLQDVLNSDDIPLYTA